MKAEGAASRRDHGDASAPASLLCVAGYAPRDASRAFLRRAFPRRRARIILARTPAELESIFRHELVDAATVDVDRAGSETWAAAKLAREFPTAPFFGIAPYRGADGPSIARCVEYEFADVLALGVDDEGLRELVLRDAFSMRFARALHTPPASLRLTTDLQRRTWRAVIASAGRPVRTSALAKTLGLTREHLSRKFATGGAPNLKRIIDLVRLLAAAELSKNPGYDVADVAAVLGFASASHLSTAAQRLTGAKPVSLARLRAVDLVKRFAEGRARSRS